MKKLLIASSLLSLAFGSAAYAAPSISATAKVRIVPAISITETTQLDFGSVIPAGTAGTVAITASASSVRTPTTVTVIPASSFAAGRLNVTGETTATYAITLPANGVVTVTGAGAPMNVNNFVSSPSGTGVLSGGTQDIYVGATLSVGASQATGSYTGNYTVSVAYN